MTKKGKAEQPTSPEAVKTVPGLKLAVNRCPFCHDDVQVDQDDWVPCVSCQARHHLACWEESGCCAACASEQHLVPGGTSERRGRGWVAAAALGVVLTLGYGGVRYLESEPTEAVTEATLTEAPVPAPSLAKAPLVEAKQSSSQVPELDPEVELRSWWSKGFSLVRDSPAEAIPAFERALAFDPNHRYYRASLGRLVEARARTGDYEGAIRDANLFLEFDNRSGFATAHAWRALAHLGLGQPEAAIADTERALAITKNCSSLAYCFRGDAYLALGRQGAAMQDYERAIALGQSPYDSQPYRHRGRLLYQLGDYAGALRDHRHALVAPQIPNEHLQDLRWIARAQSALSCAVPLEHDPRFAFAYDAKGELRQPDAYLQGTLDEFRQATGLKVGDRYAYSYRALARRLRGDAQGAIEDYNRVLATHRRNAKALVGRGNAYFDLGVFEEAIRDYTASLESRPAGREAYFDRGLARWKLKQFEQAEADLSTALKLDPQLTQAYAIRGLVRLALGKKEAGRSDIAKALQGLPPDSPGAKELEELL